MPRVVCKRSHIVCDECIAAFMADVYGRITQKVGVWLCTLGPGATNLTTGGANANMDRSPVLAITGRTDTPLLHKESHQNIVLTCDIAYDAPCS